MKFPRSIHLGALMVAFFEAVPAVLAATRLGSANEQAQHVVATAAAKAPRTLSASGVTPSTQQRVRRSLKKAGPCTIVAEAGSRILEDGAVTGTDEDEFVCFLENGKSVSLDMTKKQKADMIKGLNEGKWVSDETVYDDPEATVDGEKISVPRGTKVLKKMTKKSKKNKKNENKDKGPFSGSSGKGRHLRAVVGDLEFLVVKVIDANGLQRSENEAQIEDDIFGTDIDTINLKSQLSDCSFGQTNILSKKVTVPPAPYVGDTGVITITLDIDIHQWDRNTVSNAARAKLDEVLGFAASSQYDYVMFVLPKLYVSWAAFAGVNSWYSFYQDSYFKYAGVQIHEIGHNFNLAHSGGLNGQTYTDHTCQMGNPLYGDDLGKMCWNPAKNWQLSKNEAVGGWYASRHSGANLKEIDPILESSWSGRFLGVANYDATVPDDVIVLKLETRAQNDFFIGFNRATGINLQNDEADDQVTVVQVDSNNGEGYSQSFLKATLSKGDEYVITNFGGTGRDVIITVTNIDVGGMSPGYAEVTVEYNPCASDADCDDGISCNGVETCVSELCSSEFPPSPPRDLSVELLTDNYPSETTWDVKNPSGVVVMSGSGYSASTQQSPITAEVYPECDSGNYTFTINDSYGDGICCSYGSGLYVVKLDGVNVASGGTFDLQEIKSFPVPVSSPPTPSPTEAVVTPLPSGSPTNAPTSPPTSSPTTSPTVSPSYAPTGSPTTSPTVSPSYAPTGSPIVSPTKAPTIPTDTPTVVPTVPAPDAYYTACGASGRCQLAKEAQQKDTLHEVRCCSDTQITNWPKKNNCDVWAESDIGETCYHGEMHSGAAAICEGVGARLCTVQELLGDCTRGSGCGHDVDMIWSSDPVVPTAAPTSYPTMEPSTARPTATMQPTQKGASGETGRVGVSHRITTVQTRYIYQDPVVVAFVNSRNEDDSVDVRVMDVTSRSFKVFLEEADGGETPFNHAEEQVSYIVMEKGHRELEGGLIVEAGSHTTTSVHNAPQQFSGDSITFTEPFTGIAMPAVLTTLNTNNNGQFMSSLATNVNLNSFEISQEALQTNSMAVAETIGWMAFSTMVGTTTNGSPYISGYAESDGTSNGVAQTAYSINLSTATFTELPDLVVGLYETTGLDGAYARGAGIFTNTQQTIYAEEDQTVDGERNHVSVPAAWVGFMHNSDLFAAVAPLASCTPAQEACESSEECCSGECLGERKCAGTTTTI